MVVLERREYCVVIPTSRGPRQAWRYAWQNIRIQAHSDHECFQIVQPTKVTLHPHLFFGEIVAYRFLFDVLQEPVDDGWIEP